MTKYRLLCPIPHTDYEVGEIFEYMGNMLQPEEGRWLEAKPHEILLMVKAGILEEVKEEENDDGYWYLSDDGKVAVKLVWEGILEDRFRKKTGNMFKTQAEAQAALNKIMEK